MPRTTPLAQRVRQVAADLQVTASPPMASAVDRFRSRPTGSDQSSFAWPNIRPRTEADRD